MYHFSISYLAWEILKLTKHYLGSSAALSAGLDWSALTTLSSLPGLRDEVWMNYHEVTNGLPQGTLPRNGPLPGQAEFSNAWVYGSSAIGMAGATVLLAPEIIAAAPAAYASGASIVGSANTASLTAQAAVLSRAPELYTVGVAAVGLIRAAAPGASPPSPITASQPVVAWAEFAGNVYGYRNEISNLTQGAYNAGSLILSSVYDGLSRINEPYNTPPGLRGSVILNVPNPSTWRPTQPSQASSNIEIGRK